MQTIGYQAGKRQLIYRDDQLSRPVGQSPFEQFSALPALDPGTALWVYDDFNLTNSGYYTAVKGTGGALANLTTRPGGWLSVPTAASANDYQLLSTAGPVCSLKSYTPIAFEFAINVTEANTNQASWFCGLTSTTASGFLQTTGAPASNYSGCVFWKAKGGMALKAQTSNATTQSSTGTLATVVSGQTYVLGAFLDPDGGVTGKVTLYVGTIAGGARTFLGTSPLTIPMASLANMYLAFGVMAGSASAEALTIDYFELLQARPLV